MQTDKNTVIGFVLLGILFFVFFWYTNKQQHAIAEEQKKIQDSTARVNAAKVKPADVAAFTADSLQRDSLAAATRAGEFVSNVNGQEQLVTVENKLMKAVFSSRGGMLKQVELKNYKSIDDKPVILGGAANDGISYTINTGQNLSASSDNFLFAASPVQPLGNGSQLVRFTLQGNNQSIVHDFVVKDNEYMIDWKLSVNGATTLLTNNTLNLNWQMLVRQHQKDKDYEKQQSRLAYVEDGEFDYNSATDGATHSFEAPANWASFKQQFFNTTLIAKNKFNSGTLTLTSRPDTTKELYAANADLKVALPSTSSAAAEFQLYYGPSDYYTLRKYNNEMENLVDLGSGVFSFVKYINRFIIMPVFDFFAGFISNYGWVILFLTIFIRVVTAPLTYSSYLSGAKMKVLRPELDLLRKKHGDDQQAFAMDQMKLFREAGVNPLGGCIPALLQIPIFFALYSFFNSHIDLRGVPFLWADDLAQWDSIATLPFDIWGYGSHVSLFTLTACLTSFLISYYNMSMTPDTGNPAMKYMPYIFPFILIFIFNKLPSALTWYYTVSNVVTLGLQFVIINYVINHDKVLAKIEATRKKPKVKSKWQQRYEEVLESQKKMQDMKNKKPGGR